MNKNYYKNNKKNELITCTKVKDNSNIKGIYSIELINKYTNEIEVESKSENIVLIKNWIDNAMHMHFNSLFRPQTNTYYDNDYSESNQWRYTFYNHKPFALYCSNDNQEENENIDKFNGEYIMLATRANTSNYGADYGFLQKNESTNIRNFSGEYTFEFPDVTGNDKEFSSLYMLPINSNNRIIAEQALSISILNYNINFDITDRYFYAKGNTVYSNNIFRNDVQIVKNNFSLEAAELPNSVNVNDDFYLKKVKDNRYIGFARENSSYSNYLILFDENFNFISKTNKTYSESNTEYLGKAANVYFNETLQLYMVLFKVNSYTVGIYYFDEEMNEINYQPRSENSNILCSYIKNGIYYYNNIKITLKDLTMETLNQTSYYTYSYKNNENNLYIVAENEKLLIDSYGKAYLKMTPFSYTKLPMAITKTSDQYMKIKYSFSIDTSKLDEIFI